MMLRNYIVNIDSIVNTNGQRRPAGAGREDGLTDARHLTTAETAALLGVARETLYAYVSRGLLRSEPVPGDPRSSRFLRDDVEALRARRELRRQPEKAAQQGLHWGAPVLDSALTLIEGGRLYYRGHDVLELARTWSVERVAALLWTGRPDDAGLLFPAEPAEATRGLAARVARLGPVERCQVVLPQAGAHDLAACDLRPAAVAAAGARILSLLLAVAGGAWSGASLAGRLQQGWAPRRPRVALALRAALILCADHELNVSAFTARCVASAAASPYDVVSAGLAALKGGRHGGYTERVEALFREAGRPERARGVLGERLRRGETLPGFGHPLYPAGDPRARALVALAQAGAGAAPASRLALALRDAARDLVGEEPTLDFGLVALAHALRLPPGAPLSLFALGRTIGWIGHALEQYALDRLIRPRARYVGQAPSSEPAAGA